MGSRETRGAGRTTQGAASPGRSVRAGLLMPGLVVPGLVAIYLAVLILPVAAAWLQGLPPRPWRDELASALALCAFAGIQIEFLLSGRFRVVSRDIGIDTTMRMHQLMARTLTLFVLVHPFLYVTGMPSYPMPWDTTRQLSVDFGLTSVLTGLVAWLALLAVVVLAMFREQWGGSYELWRASHGLGAAVVAIFGTWHALSAGRYSADPVLAWFWIAMLALAMATLAWVYLVKPLWQVRNPYVVRSVRKVAERTWELVVTPERGEVIDFAAGQFVWLNIGHSPFSLNENPFSIASAPATRDHLAFVIKEVGDFTRSLSDVAPGTPAYLDGPHGNMTVEARTGAGIALYAGGVGIAPILSILRELTARSDPRPVLLLYGNRKASQIVYREEIEAMRQGLDLDVGLYLSEPPGDWEGDVGMIDAAALDRAFGTRDPARWLHVICGPLPMIEGIEAGLIARGVPDRQIISERFYYD